MPTYKDKVLEALDYIRERVEHDQKVSPAFVLKLVSWIERWNGFVRRS